MAGPVSKVSKVRVAGPLAPFADGFTLWLRDLGYTPLSTVTQLRLVAQLSVWLEAGGFGAADLTDARVEGFLAARRSSGCSWLISRRALTPLLEFLAAGGQLPAVPPAATPASPSEVVVAAFHDHLLSERGLMVSTADAYVLRARRFMAGCAPDGRLDEVTAADVTRAVLEVSTAMSVGSAQMFIASLRSFLRFAHVEGLAGADLSAAALTATGRRSSALPRGISRPQADALLSACDRRRAIGRRDFAVIVVLQRLGLRAGEVAALRLDDIDWRAGELVVHGKGRRVERLPLPVEVGEAIAGYLQRGRPATTYREVFVSAIAPIGPIGRGAVSSIVRRACVRAG
ncbi:MAG: tyrosine-type recombinase/integrase, partial [Nitriliruptoraceae bacterium]